MNESLNPDIGKASQFYMAWNRDPEVLKDSSSGGVFTAIAEYVLLRGGVVYGAALNDQTREVEHIKVDNIDNLGRLRWSKYYQSEIGDTYLEIKELLADGSIVLFSGTPCQIAALYEICGTVDNLITAEVLCHGVTSKYVVDEYIESQESRFKKHVKEFYFRVKDDIVGWKNGGSRIKLVFSDDTIRICDRVTDTFYVAYNKNLILRPSCYNCKFCRVNRLADFTMADFWGIDESKVSKEDIKNGVSLLLVNTDKGQHIIDDLVEFLEMSSITSDEAISHNRALVAPSQCPSKRADFFSRLRKGKDYNKLIKSIFAKYYLKNNLKNMAKKLLGEDHYKKIISVIKHSSKGKCIHKR